ncbi:MAG: DNA polymerase III subunit alpha [Alicyclobacillus macrosporangiidus]|uniref:DNA polymerase III subunit alpha n=1 Tax=Alicyclobacillus macrosporangiidus TaxID=392015 RepID=UPI0026EC2B34|nr:DNA polymerase III subunit alpha [Alicyclobacillus macrosporangiidus]MCL6598038.1 DNA polymerase III subunit alpha [Alicyclobacillus macrosporangiidus]
MGFVHLHVHSEYSLREGALRLADLVRLAAEMEMPAVAVTDTNALYGAVAFYQMAKQAGVKPIVGAQLTVGADQDAETLAEGRPNGPPVDHAVLLATCYEGYQNLVRLVTRAHQRDRQPFVTFSELASHSEGLIALVGGGESLPLRWFSAGREAEAVAWLKRWADVWPAGDLYIDVQDHQLPEERRGLPGLVRAARQLSLPLVATNDVHYARREDAPVQRVLAQIEAGPGAQMLQGDLYHFASPEEMARRFAKLPEALAGTLAIAERCQLTLPIGQTLLPRYPTQGEPAAVVLRRAAEAGARQRYGELTEAVRERLDYELGVIERMGFSDYFLVVADFIRFAHKNGISTGPGRGSAAGSLVAYALRITDVDPLRHKLLFERFLNPERVSWPDIDTDFEYERRGEVIRYVVERYGVDHVAQIGTFGTLAARAAIRDAGRALQADAGVIDRLARLIPSHPGMTLAKALEEAPAIGQMLAESPEARRVWETARGIEGFPRHTSIHAAGVVISPVPLSDLVPVQPGADGVPVTQYAMEDIEALGLIKMDFLGLRTLTLIDRCTASVEARTGQKVDWRRIPEDDPLTYAMLARGETNGCFQLESAGVRRVLRDLRPTGLEDLIAVISLYRPGPMENIPAYIDGKHGRAPVTYPHPDLEPILRDTYGVIVYQEQIMQIASRMAGFSLGQADLLRRAVGKKKREVLDAERSRFVEGCVRSGYDEALAHSVYDLIVRFADYGFNRSHAAAYAVLAFRTAYLRAHHTADFLAALLTMAMGDETKTREYVRDARQHGIRVLPPSVLESGAGYTVEADDAIRTGLLAIRNVGRGAVEAILEARAQGPFRSLVDFLQRVNPRVCNRKAVESLLTAGALSSFLPEGASRQAALDILEEAYQLAEEGRQSQGLGLSWDEGRPVQERVLYIRYDPRRGPEDVLERVKDLLVRQPGTVRVALYDQARRRARLLQPRWSVALTPELIGALEEVVGIGNAKVGWMPRR